MYVTAQATAFLLLIVGAALSGRAMGIITAKRGIRLVRRLGYRGRTLHHTGRRKTWRTGKWPIAA